jgi:hypothetical protein
MTPPQCPTTEAPGLYFQKEFFHNGYAKSLKWIFYGKRASATCNLLILLMRALIFA